MVISSNIFHLNFLIIFISSSCLFRRLDPPVSSLRPCVHTEHEDDSVEAGEDENDEDDGVDLLKPATAATGGRVKKAGVCVKLWLAGIYFLVHAIFVA